MMTYQENEIKIAFTTQLTLHIFNAAPVLRLQTVTDSLRAPV